MNELIWALESQNYPDIGNITYNTLPKVGFRYQDIAFGFLRMVEGGYAQIDTLVSNANYPSEDRHEAVTAVVNELLRVAKYMELNGIICFTKEPSIIARAKELGFHLVDQTIIAKSLI